MKKSAALPLKLTVSLAMLSAISIICGKYLSFGIGNVMRFSFENLPIIFAGIAFGPLAGLLVGAVSDLVGCLLVGYEINWLVTVGAAFTGAVSGFSSRLLKLTPIRSEALIIILSVFLSHTVGSVIIKTVGLAVYYAMPIYMLMLWRLFNYLIVGTVEAFLLIPLMKNKALKRQLSSIRQVKNAKGDNLSK